MKHIIITLVALFMMGNAYGAPNLPAIPGSADAAKIIKEDHSLSAAPQSAPPSDTTSTPLKSAVPAGTDTVFFVLKDITIEGSTIYDQRELKPIYQHDMGKKIPVSKLYTYVDAINNRYHHDGYELTTAVIPSQEISNGNIRIRVIENYIERVIIKGNYHKNAVIDDIIRKLKTYHPLKNNELERAVLLINDLPGISVRSILKAPEKSDMAPIGAMNLVLVFNDVKIRTTVNADNAGSRYVGPFQEAFQTSITNHLLPNQEITINGSSAVPLSELQFSQIAHRVILNSCGLLLVTQLSYVHSQPGYTLRSEELDSKSLNAKIALSEPLIRSQKQNLYVGAELTANNSTTDALGQALSEDRIRVLTLFANYNNVDTLGNNNAQFRLSQGLNIADATETGSKNLSRAEGHSDFTKITSTLSRTQRLTSVFSIYANASGQLSRVSLLSSEQFGYGGQQFGRAYDSWEIAGDNGVEGAIELRYDGLPQFPKFSTELFTYYDIGRVWNNDFSGDKSASSVGIGISVSGNSISGTLTIADPLTKKVSTPITGNGSSPRIIMTTSMQF